MAWYVYKCNDKQNKYDPKGINSSKNNWAHFFGKYHIGEAGEWGLYSIEPKLKALSVGDMVLAYQVENNMLVGLA